MTITRSDPGTIWLGGPRTVINDMGAKAAITPGHLVERVNTAGVWQWQKHSTAAGDGQRAVACEQSMLNKDVDDDYAINDLVEVAELGMGSNAWMFIASGQNIAYGDNLESAGDGTLRVYAAGVKLFQALETKANVTVLTRIRVEVI
ncbi:MAG: hypothetical protein NUV51_09360 [Sulfuricaulis sp.]|nr:hypothetical protein [Sulfuricaulis sp.]